MSVEASLLLVLAEKSMQLAVTVSVTHALRRRDVQIIVFCILRCMGGSPLVLAELL